VVVLQQRLLSPSSNWAVALSSSRASVTTSLQTSFSANLKTMASIVGTFVDLRVTNHPSRPYSSIFAASD
jgi:hypothetical protein